MSNIMIDKNDYNETKLFAGFSGKTLPFEPIEEISIEKAEQLPSYLEGKYDSQGRLTILIKYINGKIYFRQEIQYKDGEKFKVIYTDPDGKVTEKLIE